MKFFNLKNNTKNDGSDNLELECQAPKVLQLNKPLILSCFGIIIFLILFSITNAFTVKNKPTHDAFKTKLPQTSQDYRQDSEVLNQLPGSYQETSKIKQYQRESEHRENVSSVTSEIRQELDAIKNQYVELSQKMSDINSNYNNSPNMENTHPHKDMPYDDPQNQQARASGLYFSDIKSGFNSHENLNAESGHANTGKNAPINGVENDVEYGNEKEISNLNRTYNSSNYEIKSGTLIKASLITSINTSLPGTVIAQITEDIFDTKSGKFILIPKGSKLLGQYDANISYGQRRILLVFSRIVRPNGSSVMLDKYGATDLQGNAGIEGKVDNHFGRIISSAALSTLLSVGSGVASDSFITGNGSQKSAKQNAILGISSGVSQVGQRVIDRSLDIQPTLSVPSGFQFNVIVQKDIVINEHA